MQLGSALLGWARSVVRLKTGTPCDVCDVCDACETCTRSVCIVDLQVYQIADLHCIELHHDFDPLVIPAQLNRKDSQISIEERTTLLHTDLIAAK